MDDTWDARRSGSKFCVIVMLSEFVTVSRGLVAV